MRALVAVACVLAFGPAAVQPVAAAATPGVRVHTVQQILRDGKPVASAAGVTVTPQSGPPQESIRSGETIADGTRIDVPAHLIVVIMSTGGLSTVRLTPGAEIVFISTGKGETVRAYGGRMLFDVVHDSLDFYRVQYGDQIVAGVNGTAFSVAATSETVTFACTRDEINVTKTGYLVIGAQRRKLSLVDTIAAGHAPVTYAPTQTWTLGTFATYAAAEASFRRQLAAATSAGDRNAEASAYTNIGLVQAYQGQDDAALASHLQALALNRALGNRDGEARALNNIGIVQTEQSQYDAALASYQRALAIDRELGDDGGQAEALTNIGIVQRRRGDYEAALQSQLQALKLFRAGGDRVGQASALGNIGVLQAVQGQHAAALASYQQALALHRQLGDRDGEARDFNNIGIEQKDLGHYDAALQSDQQALALHHQLGDGDGEARAIINIGVVFQLQGNHAAARESYQQALTQFQQIGDRDGEALAITNIGSVQENEGQYAAALESYQQALDVYKKLGAQGTNVDQTLAAIRRVTARLNVSPSSAPQSQIPLSR